MMTKKILRSKARATIADSALANQLHEIAALMKRKRCDAARAKLKPLSERHPNHVEVLEQLVNLCHEQKDLLGYQQAIERLSHLLPDDPDVALGLAGAYLSNVRPMLALRAIRRFLRRWPASLQRVRRILQGSDRTGTAARQPRCGALVVRAVVRGRPRASRTGRGTAAYQRAGLDA